MTNWTEIKPKRDDNEKVFSPSQAGESVEGVLVDTKENVGPNNSKLYSLEQPDGTVVKVWGSTVLDSRMEVVGAKSYIKIVYQGLGVAKAGRKAPKLFNVFVGE